ncbi:MAG: hypothetical protein V4734_12240, partial [Terriglobus sp.]
MTRHGHIKSRALWGSASLLLAACVLLLSKAQIAVKNQGYVPFSEAPINYRSDDLSDPVAKLQQRLDRGDATLTYEPEH